MRTNGLTLLTKLKSITRTSLHYFKQQSHLSIFTMLLTGLLLSSCGDKPKTFTPQSADSFVVDNEDIYETAGALLQADFLFVADFSFSMSFNSRFVGRNKKDDFLDSLYDFVDQLHLDNVDYQIGLVNGNVHSTNYSSISSNFLGGLLLNSSMSSSARSSVLSQLNTIGRPLQRNTNLILNSALRTMTQQKDSFVREGSQLVYVFVSDTDDESYNRAVYVNSQSGSVSTGTRRSPASYASALQSFKSNNALVSARTIITGYDHSGDSCNPALFYGEEAGHDLAETARLIEGNGATRDSVSSCILTGNFPATMQNLAKDVRKPTDYFPLQVGPAVESTIRVYVNGQANHNWTYSSSDNALNFNPAPGASSRVEIYYDQYFPLSRTPSSFNSLNVRINGNSIPQSTSNGWGYNSNLNAIRFYGSSTPDLNDRVQIDYND